MKIRKVEEKVKKILTEVKLSRDNDKILLSCIWNIECGGSIRTKDITAWDFLTMLSQDKLSNPVSIWRSRQKLQELYPDLRGKKYESRQKHASDVKEEIQQWDPLDDRQTEFWWEK